MRAYQLLAKLAMVTSLATVLLFCLALLSFNFPQLRWLTTKLLDSGGFAKVHEYTCNEEVKRKYSVAFVTRRRSTKENACLCFSLVSKIPSQKPWARDPDVPDPCRSVILGLEV